MVAATPRPEPPDWEEIEGLLRKRARSTRVCHCASDDCIHDAFVQLLTVAAEGGVTRDWSAYAVRLWTNLHRPRAGEPCWVELDPRVGDSRPPPGIALWFRRTFLPELRDVLTDREDHVLDGILCSESQASIARRLRSDAGTVRRSIRSIVAKGRKIAQQRPPQTS